jgi:hypothetical protein
MDLSKEQVEQVIRDTCPRCQEGLAVEQRSDTGEFVHRPFGPHSIQICLATHLREKYGNVLNG